MTGTQPHDVRLVYMACAWLVANRGHFLFDIPVDEVARILDFNTVYQEFCDYLTELGYGLPWAETIHADELLAILRKDCGVRKKEEAFAQAFYDGKKIPKACDEDFPFSRAAIVTLLAGGKVKPSDLFGNELYAESESVSLTMSDEDFVRVVAELDEDAQLLYKLRAMRDCVQLLSSMKDCRCISQAKVAVYEQHQRDLRFLKGFVKKYIPKKYDAIFRNPAKDNYVSYSGNGKSLNDDEKKNLKSATKDSFSDFLLKQLKELPVTEADRPAYEDMLSRLQARTFLPKQKDGDNRVVPQQLYRYELQEILNHAQEYLPMLLEADEDGITVKEKILSIFDFKIPYFVGPLHKTGSNHAWLVRKQEGRILPWNFEQLVDLDASEQGFIQRMINRCTYLPGEEVLPVNSLLYEKFTVLNEINNLKINALPIPVALKQELYNEVFCRCPRVTGKRIREYLCAHGHMAKEDELSGIDITVKANLKSHHIFRRMMETGLLTQADVEKIIRHAAYSEDKTRLRKWLIETFPKLSEEDISYLLRQKQTGFGRLSARLLCCLYGSVKDSDTGEAFTILDAMWETNDNLMQLLSGKYTFAEQIQEIRSAYYAENPCSLNDKLDEMYVSNAVKRPIFRTLDIVQDIVKANGCAPARIFVEMARGGTAEQKGKRTKSRKEQLLELYKQVKNEDSRRLQKELEEMGVMADNRLQSDRLFLYYLQLGKSAYTKEPIVLSHLADGTYNLEHIYPQCHVKDDSILNNLVLVESEINGMKRDTYPVPEEIRRKMTPFWHMLKENGLMTEEKYRRLTRSTGFTPEEKMGFINRQLVETRQATKVMKDLLQEKFPETQIICVKAELVSEFRQAFEMLKCRSVNDLHHAKDAYLSIVVGNVYHEKFTKHWFDISQKYSIKTKTLFADPVIVGDQTVWRGEEDIALVKKAAEKNAVHLTRYAFCRKGGLFKQKPVRAGSGLVPRKANLPAEKYGGYNKTTASFYLLASYTIKSKKDIMFVPIELMYADRVMADHTFAAEYIASTISTINGGKPVENVRLLLGGRKIKINTVIEANGMRLVLKSKNNGGKEIVVSPCIPLILGATMERYVKRLEAFAQKRREGAWIVPDAVHDHITAEENLELYDQLCSKLTHSIFDKCPGNIAETVVAGRDQFSALAIEEQIPCLLSIIAWFGIAPSCDLKSVGGSGQSGTKRPNARLTSWTKSYSDVRIIDQSASGLFERRSENLLELL